MNFNQLMQTWSERCFTDIMPSFMYERHKIKMLLVNHEVVVGEMKLRQVAPKNITFPWTPLAFNVRGLSLEKLLHFVSGS